MARRVSIGHQDFEEVIRNHYFYVDKTLFIREWWENGDVATLITRPRRFGKTLTMSMVEKFFSVKYAGRGELFEGLSIWQEEKYRRLQGTYPVISFSFANIKEGTYEKTKEKICQLLAAEYQRNAFLLESGCLTEGEKAFFNRKTADMGDMDATLALNQLSEYLSRYYGKKVIILLDEYDTPMQEAYVHGYWEELMEFTRSMFNAAFKTNPYLERAVLTGITRISKESVFSDLNNLEVITTTSRKYETSFGFTQDEVDQALEEFGLSERKEEVKDWYDGFGFGNCKAVYNPWSILNYLDKRKFFTYWANTSSNSLVGKLIREGSRNIKLYFEALLNGETVKAQLDEQIVYNQLNQDENALWSLLLACGYLKVKSLELPDAENPVYELEITNYEVRVMFRSMVRGWFGTTQSDYNDFIQAFLQNDLDAMNEYMNRVAENTFSYFDTGMRPSQKEEPERFYHGFVLGLMVDLADQYAIHSNRESGFGRYDVILEPKKEGLDAAILEFKVFNPRREKTLEDTVNEALGQIEKKRYDRDLRERGIPDARIRKYGFAFRGKEVLIGI